jgi:hypothetical protein
MSNFENDRLKFKEIITTNSNIENPTIYVILGDQIHIKNYDIVLNRVIKWCDENDKLHNNNWSIITMGESKNGISNSLCTILEYICSRGVKITFIQSHWLFSTPGDRFWPRYCSAGLYGPGVYDKINNTEIIKGFSHEQNVFIPNSKKEISFFDSTIKWLNMYINGILCIGGTSLTREQTEIHRLCNSSRKRDMYIAVIYDTFTPTLNMIYAPNKDM